MQKILSLGSLDFLKGIALSPYEENVAPFEKLEGIDIWRNTGLLMSGYDKTDKTGSITGKIRWFSVYPPGTKAYVYSTDTVSQGKIHSINLGTNTPSFIDSCTNSDAQGMEIYKDYLILSMDTRVGKYGLLSGSPSIDTDGISGVAQLTDSGYHPIKIGPDLACYVANKNTLCKFTDVASAPSADWTTGALTLQTDFQITALENDGNYLVVAASINSTTTYGSNLSKVVFWDTWSQSFNKEYPIPTSFIYALQRYGEMLYAFTSDGVYEFNYDTPPKPVFHEGSGIRNLYCEAEAGATDIWKGQVLFGSSNLWAYGSPDNRLRKILTNPLKITTGGDADSLISAIKVINSAKIYVGGISSSTYKFYVFSTGSSSGIATTSLIDLKRTWKIEGIKIVGVPGTNSVVVQVQNDQGTNILTGTYDGTKQSAFIKTLGTTADVVTDQIIIDLDFTGESQIKRIDVFGTPMPENYARR